MPAFHKEKQKQNITHSSLFNILSTEWNMRYTN